MTGKVKNIPLLGTSSFAVVYEDDEVFEWPLGKHFLLYKALLLPKKYLEENRCENNLRDK